MGGRGKREDEGQEMEAGVRVWNARSQDGMRCWRRVLDQGELGVVGGLRGDDQEERYQCVFVLSDRVMWWEQNLRFP